MSDPFLRPARPDDRQALLDIALVTANSGGDATALYSDPDYPGQVWAVPYLALEPDFSFVVDLDGTAAGFVVGTPDTLAFERRLERDWWPALRARYAGRTAIAPHDHRVLDYIRQPPTDSGPATAAYPAHLHINLLPALKGGGWGRRLIEAELAALRRAGIPGVHLGVSAVNHHAIGFYEHVGFQRLAPDGDGILYAMRLA